MFAQIFFSINPRNWTFPVTDLPPDSELMSFVLGIIMMA
jgi:hypothetical protein